MVRGETGGKTGEGGRVAAFRTTDTHRGFIPSPKIQHYASGAGAETRRVCECVYLNVCVCVYVFLRAFPRRSDA